MSVISEQPPTTDEVLREVRRIKEELAQKVDFNIDRIIADARAKQLGRGRRVLSPPAKRVH